MIQRKRRFSHSFEWGSSVLAAVVCCLKKNTASCREKRWNWLIFRKRAAVSSSPFSALALVFFSAQAYGLLRDGNRGFSPCNPLSALKERFPAQAEPQQPSVGARRIKTFRDSQHHWQSNGQLKFRQVTELIILFSVAAEMFSIEWSIDCSYALLSSLWLCPHCEKQKSDSLLPLKIIKLFTEIALNILTSSASHWTQAKWIN